MLNKRCFSILAMILNSKGPIMIDAISKNFKVSDRTVRYDLDKIDDYLKEIEIPMLFRKPNFGIELILTEVQKSKVMQGDVDTYKYVLSQNERIKVIIFELIQEEGFITIKNLADKLYVSRGTIIKDLIQVKEWLKKNKLKLVSFKSHGIKVSGDEKYLRSVAYLLLTENIEFKPKLIEFITKDYVTSNIEVDNWEAAVQKSGQVLLKNGCINENYIQVMIDIVKNMGPYIVIAPGVAMAHARPEDGVIKVGISIATLKSAIWFGNQDNDPVKVVISICSTNHSSHMSALSELVEIVDREDFVQHVSKAKDDEELIELLMKEIEYSDL